MDKKRNTSKEAALLAKMDIPFTTGKIKSQIYIQGKKLMSWLRSQ